MTTLRSIFHPELFARQRALVTGGGSGIGLRIARELRYLGAEVHLLGRKLDKLQAARESLLADLTPLDTAVLTHQADIREESRIAEVVQEITREHGPIQLLVNNAGGQFPAPAEKINKRGWQAVVETNLTGTFLVSREVFTHSMRAHGGAIVNITAVHRQGFPLMAHTGAARAGVTNLARSLANEWGRYGVRVNCVAPGIIASSGLDTYDASFQKNVQAFATYNQAQRMGTEAEVASAVLFLLSPAAAFITGESLTVDGGHSIYAPNYPPVAHDRNLAFEDRA